MSPGCANAPASGVHVARAANGAAQAMVNAGMPQWAVPGSAEGALRGNSDSTAQASAGGICIAAAAGQAASVSAGTAAAHDGTLRAVGEPVVPIGSTTSPADESVGAPAQPRCTDDDGGAPADDIGCGAGPAASIGPTLPATRSARTVDPVGIVAPVGVAEWGVAAERAVDRDGSASRVRSTAARASGLHGSRPSCDGSRKSTTMPAARSPNNPASCSLR